MDCLKFARGFGKGSVDNAEFKAVQGGVLLGEVERKKREEGPCKGFTVGLLIVVEDSSGETGRANREPSG